MQLQAQVIQAPFDALRAREDTLFLWRNLEFAGHDPEGRSDVAVIERCKLDLPARYRVGDNVDFVGEVTEISPLGVHIAGPKIGRLGEFGVANIPAIGIVEGGVTSTSHGHFVIGVVASTGRLRSLAQRFSWAWLREKGQAEERRDSPRVEMNRAKATIETAEGRFYPCEIFDLSTSGAALHLGASALYFYAGQTVNLDGRPAHVLRYFPGGVVITFE